jgi:hypothetical protein
MKIGVKCSSYPDDSGNPAQKPFRDTKRKAVLFWVPVRMGCGLVVYFQPEEE